MSPPASASPQAGLPRLCVPVATILLVLICLAVFMYDNDNLQTFVFGAGPSDVGGRVVEDLGRFTLYAPSLDIDGEWYRAITAGFVHFSWQHLGMNLVLLAMTGRLIEGTFGTLTFVSVYATGLIAGSLGALLLDGHTQVGGASGAIFALLGAMAVLQHMAGHNALRSGIAPLLALNLLLSLAPAVSLGGHVGGLAAGVVAGVLIGRAHRRGPKALASVPALVAGLGFVVLLASVPAARWATAQIG